MQNFDEILNNEYIQTLEENVYDFKLNKIFNKNDEGNFNLFSYSNDNNHRQILIYHHTDTNEFRVQVHFGLNVFCISDFFTSNFDIFVESLKTQLPKILRYYNFFEGTEDELVLEKNFDKWQYGNDLPLKLNDFELFIKPSKALEITNGSFVIIDYCDFTNNSDFVIYYNIYSDDYGGELRINGTTVVLSEFDTDDLKTLENQLKTHLEKCLSKQLPD